MSLSDQSFSSRMQRIEVLVQEAERLADPAAQDLTRELVQALLDLHAAGLANMLNVLARTPDGRVALDACVGDGVVSSMLLLHGLHPLDLETRVRQALEKVGPALKSHGGGVELLAVEDGTVRLRMEGNCHGCPSSAETLKQTIEEAICEAAPDATRIDVEGVAEFGKVHGPTQLISLPVLNSVMSIPR